jgi:hypothetical protein
MALADSPVRFFVFCFFRSDTFLSLPMLFCPEWRMQLLYEFYCIAIAYTSAEKEKEKMTFQGITRMEIWEKENSSR